MSVAQKVVAQFDRMMGADGGRIELVEETASAVRIRYWSSTSQCETCIMTAADLRELVSEALQRQAPSITQVEVVTA